MKINSQVHVVRKEFFVTPEVKRFINIYVIVGEYCYLVDTGVTGSHTVVEEYLTSINRKMSDIKGIFLTHSHPDHIGAAAELQRQTNCAVYAPIEELNWIEDVQNQFSQRPIPNFFKLLSESVKVSHPLHDGDIVEPEKGIKIRALSTKGHSHGSMSFVLNEEVVFTGDAIMVEDDFPIFVDYEQTLKSFDLLQNMHDIIAYCPAWDDVYDKEKLDAVIQSARARMAQLKTAVVQVEKDWKECTQEEKLQEIYRRANLEKFLGNPLVKTSVEACRD